jgi:hypothetical protein
MLRLERLVLLAREPVVPHGIPDFFLEVGQHSLGALGEAR